MNSKRTFFLLIAIVVLMLAGCASVEVKDPGQALLERASQYWDARASGDMATAYKLESASLPGGWLKAHHMTRIGGGMTLSNIKVTDPQINGDQGEVTVSANLRVVAISSPKALFPQVVKDHWVLIDGQWYHKTEKLKKRN